MNIPSRVRCSRCRYVRRDPAADQPGWKAMECGNQDSEYYRALLNVTVDGDTQSRITWGGCPLGEEARPCRRKSS